MNDFDGLDFWRLCEMLSIHQAACLISGIDPSSESGANCYILSIENQPDGYNAALTAVLSSLINDKIKGNLIFQSISDLNGNESIVAENSYSIHNSKVEVESLKLWLASRGFKSGFFFPEPIVSVDYLDPNHPRYTKKLAMAVEAWLEVTVAVKISPKKALEKWMREHAAKYGLTDDNGKPNETAIEECSKVANWSTLGGVPKS